MVEKVGSDPVENRATRRKKAKMDALGRERYSWSGELSKTAKELDTTAVAWNKIISEEDRNIADIVYKGDPFVYGFLDARRGLVPLLDKMFEVNSRNPFCSIEYLRRFDAHNIYQFKLGGGILTEGTSLLDIEKMAMDEQEERGLSIGDIVRINRMLRLNFALKPLFRFKRPWSENREEKLVRQVILYSVCQKVARPELKITVPKNVQPLYERLISYCDFYTGLLTDYSLSECEELNLLRTLSLSHPWLAQMLGCYIPARLGITPSSAIKLFHERVEGSSAHPLYWRKILNTLNIVTSDAFRNNQLPAGIEPYQHYSQSDQKEEEQLFTRFLTGDLTGSQQVLAHLNSGQLMDKLALYHKIIRREIYSSPDKKIKVSVDDGVFDQMMISCQYPNTLMFLIRFREEQKQALLEIGNNIRGNIPLYGLPPKLSVQNPQLADRVLSQMLPPLIDKMILTHPEVENGYQVKPFIPVVIPSIKGQGLKEEEVVLLPRSKQKEPKEKKTTLTPLQRFLGETILPNPQSSQRKFIVLVSKSKIEESMPRNTPSSAIEQIFREIRNLETGRTTFADKVQSAADVWEVKSRRYRIFLRHEQGEIYTFVSAGKRSLEERLFRRVK